MTERRRYMFPFIKSEKGYLYRLLFKWIGLA